MCGIVAACSNTDIVPILVQGLMRLEYRGYDSCGLALMDATGLRRARSTQRVAQLQTQVNTEGLTAHHGIAHTRWATHGAPAVANAHPHFSHGPGASGVARLALVHNGIIENYAQLRSALTAQGYVFVSETDTEVLTHLLDSLYQGDLAAAVRAALPRLRGAWAIAAMHSSEPGRIVGSRHGSPLVLGLGTDVQHAATYLASDALALAAVTDQIVFLEEGDVADIRFDRWQVTNVVGQRLTRTVRTVAAFSNAIELGPYRHYMQKEIFEQPRALSDTLEGVEHIGPYLFSDANAAVLSTVRSVLILACGTSYYSGCTARYWLESIAGIPAQVEVASEYRYRLSVPDPDTLVVCISQSGETADTLAALRHAQQQGMDKTLAICNVAGSAMVRETRLHYITRAGVEVGVASTKAFTTQLAGLYLLTLVLAQSRGRCDAAHAAAALQELRHLPAAMQSVLALEPRIIAWAEYFAKHDHALFLGRGLHYPIAMEGALKLKEISYIHAEAYPAGELKHGPLALVTHAMPVVVVAPNDALLDKLKSNMQEVRARGGQLFVLADSGTQLHDQDDSHVIQLPEHYGALSPLLHVLPLQLLAYHSALVRGTDVDKPRNLAKSVTVE